MKNTDALRAQPTTERDRDQAVGEFGRLLDAIAQEAPPERLLDLAEELQTAISKRREQMTEEPKTDAYKAVKSTLDLSQSS